MSNRKDLERRLEQLAADAPSESTARGAAYTPDLSESDYEFLDEMFGEGGRDIFGELNDE